MNIKITKINTLKTILTGTGKAVADTFKDNWRWFGLLFLCLFFGFLGVHRFVVKKWGTGILYLLTFGLFGIGVVVDLIKILREQFERKDGYIVEAGITPMQRFGVFIVLLAGLEALIVFRESIPLVPQIINFVPQALAQIAEWLGPVGDVLEKVFGAIFGVIGKIFKWIGDFAS